MRRLPWHVAVRADRRALLTIMSIALGVAFSVVSFAVPDGLRTESIAEEGPFGRQDIIASPLHGAHVDEGVLERADITRVQLASIATEGEGRATIAAFTGTRAPPFEEMFAYPPAGAVGLPARLVPAGGDALPWAPPVDLALLSRAWIAVHPATFAELAPMGADSVHLVLHAPVDMALAASMREVGFVLSPAPAVEPFFRASASEIAHDLLLVVVFSVILVTIFVYECLTSEVRERRREIGLWRALGMRPADVVALVVARGLALTATGALAGAVLGHVALQAASRATSFAVFEARVSPATAALLAGAFLFAGLLGGFVPARRASRAPVRQQLEAPA